MAIHVFTSITSALQGNNIAKSMIAFLECLDVVSQPIHKPAKMHQLYIT